MKVDVEYCLKGISRNLGFYGKGTVCVHDTALVFAGTLSMFYRPLFLALFHEIVAEHTYRTIPYSKISRYRPSGSFLRRYHRVGIEQPGGGGVTVAFKIIDSTKRLNEAFAMELKEHMAALASAAVS